MKYWNIVSKKCVVNHKKKGLYLRFEKTVNNEVRTACLEFSKWLRLKYHFPVRIIVYVKSSEFIKSIYGEQVYGTCWRPYDKCQYPYIHIATGDYPKLRIERGRDNALACILNCIAIMLTHYYQWIDDFEDIDNEVKHAEYCAKTIIKEYSKTRDHP